MISLPISYTFENTKGAREEKENEMSRDWPEEISPGVSKNLRGDIRHFLSYRSVFILCRVSGRPSPLPGQRPPHSTTGQHPRRHRATQNQSAGYGGAQPAPFVRDFTIPAQHSCPPISL